MFGKTKEEVLIREIIVPKVSEVEYVEVKLKMSNGKTEKGYRLVCSCGNHDRDKFGDYIKTVMVQEEKKYRHHTIKVRALICNVCHNHDIVLTDFQQQYNDIIKKKETVKA